MLRFHNIHYAVVRRPLKSWHQIQSKEIHRYTFWKCLLCSPPEVRDAVRTPGGTLIDRGGAPKDRPLGTFMGLTPGGR